MKYSYKTKGTCSMQINFSLDGDIVTNVEFMGGCNGNLNGIASLITGMNINDVITKLEGIKCGAKDTSCPDQLAKCLIAYKNQVMQEL